MPTVMAQALANTHLCSQQLASIYFSAGVAVEDSAEEREWVRKRLGRRGGCWRWYTE